MQGFVAINDGRDTQPAQRCRQFETAMIRPQIGQYGEKNFRFSWQGYRIEVEGSEITNWLLCGGMTLTPENPNLKRRSGHGMWAQCAEPFIKPLLWFFQTRTSNNPAPLTVFQSYLVGDLFMALPALKTLAGEMDIRVVCRPDCAEILVSEGLQGLAFDNSFFIRPGITPFFRTFRSAWKLRGQLGPVALDFDADPRSAFWLKIAGAHRVVSYSRSHAVFFDALFSIPQDAVHQADKNAAVASGFLTQRNALSSKFEISSSKKDPPSIHPATFSNVWIISCWTRKDTKNWPLDRWDEFLERLMEANISFRILEAPDGNEGFKQFHQRWSQRVKFISGNLMHVADEIQKSSGVISTDNFVGHMAGYYGKPVLWINGSSDAQQVMPKGPNTQCVQVEPMPCRPCGHRCLNPDYKACLTHLDMETAWKAFRRMRYG